MGELEKRDYLRITVLFPPHFFFFLTTYLLRDCTKNDIARKVFCQSKTDHRKKTYVPHNCTFHLPLLLQYGKAFQ